MLALLRTFLDIALWRRDPGDLPASSALAAATGALYLLESWLQAWQRYGEQSAVLRAAADLGLTLAAFRLLLAMAGRGPRFRQAISAVLGVGALLSLPMLAVVGLQEPAKAHYSLALVLWVVSLTFIVWYLFALGHIVRATLGTGLFVGMAVSVAFTFGSTALLTRLIPPGH